jgi:hypothetical protein
VSLQQYSSAGATHDCSNHIPRTKIIQPEIELLVVGKDTDGWQASVAQQLSHLCCGATRNNPRRTEGGFRPDVDMTLVVTCIVVLRFD